MSLALSFSSIIPPTTRARAPRVLGLLVASSSPPLFPNTTGTRLFFPTLQLTFTNNFHSTRLSLADEESQFRKKESSHETEYANREERRALRAMLAKMERAADPDDKQATSSLEALFKKHGVKSTKALTTDLIAWKHGQEK